LDLSQLETLGKYAGIGGFAIGSVILILNSIISQTPSLPDGERAPTLRLLAIGTFAVGALGIVAWLANAGLSGQHASTRGKESPAVVGGGNVTIGPTIPAGVSAPTPQSGVAPNATARTEGDRSPAIVSGGNAVVSPPGSSSKPEPP
jgi:hypothetical protein